MSTPDTPKPPTEEMMHGKWPRRVWLPGALTEAIATRIEEVQEFTMSRYLVELIAYDLRERHAHSLTGHLSLRPPDVQQAIDLVIRRHYRPGFQSNKEQIAKVVAHGFADSIIGVGAEPLMTKTRHEVYLRRMHSGIIAERMKQLGFAHLSEYVISLIRFDLLVGGPHKHHGGPISKPMIAAHDVNTYKTFHTKPPKKCMIDYVIEEICGREMTPEERNEALRKVSEQFVEEAVAAQKRARKAG